MTVHDHRSHYRPTPESRPHPQARGGQARGGSPLSSTLAASLSPWLRLLASGVWWIEHGFERARADARPEEDTRVRIFLVMSVFSVVFVLLALGAARAALLAPKGGVGSLDNPAALVRADLVDRNGQLLAANIVHYGLYIDPAEIWDRPAALEQIGRALPRASRQRLRNAIYNVAPVEAVAERPWWKLWAPHHKSGRNRIRRLLVLNGLTPGERQAVHALELGGVSFEPEDRRAYPLNRSAAHLIGAADTGGEGVSGAELAFNAEIRDAGAAGRDFPLSIDLRVQGVLENELGAAAEKAGAKGAVGIVTDVQTGEVLGMASWPTFDANNRGSAVEGATLNRVTSGHYEMGSIFKTFTVAAGLDTGRADMNTRFDASQALMVGKRKITDFHATNQVLTLEGVYLHSSNIGTSRLAIEMGPDRMRDYFGRLGLLDAAPIELHESAKPIVPRRWDDSTLASLSFGYSIMVTPAQVAAAMGALTNGGRYIPLTLRRGDGTPVQGHRIVSAETSATILDLMRRNVVRGSGGFADAPGLRVGGKTGSANKLFQGRYNPSHAVGSFAAVFPTDGPATTRRYAIFILVDEPSSYPKTGAYVAAPAVHNIAERIAPFLGVARGADRWRTATGEKIPQPDDSAGGGH